MLQKLGITLLFLVGFQAFAADYHPNRLIVKMKAQKNLPSFSTITKSRHLFGQVYVLETQDLLELENQLKNSSLIEYVERDYFAGKRELPKVLKAEADEFDKAGSDPKQHLQWGLKDASDHGISANTVWERGLTQPRKEVIVAVVDTGVDYNHPDLKSVMWKNSGEIAGNNIDDDGNGYVDDVFGINTLTRDSDGNATGDPMDTHAHGTHVSGIIGAKRGNGRGIAGVASNVKIMAIRTVPNNGDETDVDVAESFVYAAKHGAKIINCSFGKKHNEGGKMVSEAIKHIGEKYGTLVVAAAGNESTDIDRNLKYPASFTNKNLMVVASTAPRGGLSYFSNTGVKNVDVAAPGSQIYSTVPNGRYSNMSGTSMASPMAAGLAAEVLSNFPELGPVELKQSIMDSVTKVNQFNGKMISGGRIDLLKALEKAARF